MSGGSYNYACFAYDIEDVIAKRSDIEAMCERLEGIPYATKPAEDLRAILREVDEHNTRVGTALNKLHGVMKGIEWWDSCDWGEDQFRKEVAEYTNSKEG